MLWFVKRSPEHSAALERVRQWTRARFALPEQETVLVSEVACGLPGCPPVETVIAFWSDGDKRHHWKVFKPVAEVVEDDLPPSWMKDAIIVPDTAEFDCGC
jgi:nitrate reductase delta subunit